MRTHAEAIWRAAVDAVTPARLMPAAVAALPAEITSAPRILVVGGGKAGAGMAAELEAAFPHPDRLTGLVNVPEGCTADTRFIRLHPARPAGSNHPTAAGVAGSEEMLRLLARAGPDDAAVCLLSGGGSALLPAPVDGITLADKQLVTKLLHASGATIGEMNAVRKHLSRIKGGRLAEAFRGRRLVSLVISDVVGDPLDVIASGPTAPDPTTFADALAVLDRFKLTDRVPPSVLNHLTAGSVSPTRSVSLPRPSLADGSTAPTETPKTLPATVTNHIIGSNAVALAAARSVAQSLGYTVHDLGPFVEGETETVAATVSDLVRDIRARSTPVRPPECILVGGETTVTLGPSPGKGGRNQEFVLAMLHHLGPPGMKGVVALSGGTDGEDGPTDAAGAVADETTSHVGVEDHLWRHNANPFFDRAGGLLRTGLTGTNVMDVRVVLVS